MLYISELVEACVVDRDHYCNENITHVAIIYCSVSKYLLSMSCMIIVVIVFDVNIKTRLIDVSFFLMGIIFRCFPNNILYSILLYYSALFPSTRQ